jgi:hypothetical protein
MYTRSHCLLLQALALVYQLLSASPDLCSLALSPACAVVPTVLQLLGGDTATSHTTSDSSSQYNQFTRERSSSVGLGPSAAGTIMNVKQLSVTLHTVLVLLVLAANKQEPGICIQEKHCVI